MNIMGVGLAEAGLIMLVAFLVLGPNRSMGMARTAGKVIGDLRRTFTEITAAASMEQSEDSTPVQQQDPPPEAGTEIAAAASVEQGEDSTPVQQQAPPPEAGDEPPRNAGNE